MSLVNFTLRVSHFNINININRVDFKKPVDPEALYQREQRLQEALKRKEQFEAKYYELNSYRFL